MQSRRVICLLLGSCAAVAAQASGELNRLDSVLWVQTSVEREGVYQQAYRQARAMLDKARKDKSWTAAIEQTGAYRKLPPAVILDVDETVIDNSPEQAEVAKNGDRAGLWERWVNEGNAKALPGALEFTRYAAQQKVAVFYVTNRAVAEKDATVRTLTRLGFPLQHGADSVKCRGEKPEWTNDKGSRRAAIAHDFRILLLIGDDLGDFMSGVRVAPAERRRLAEPYTDRWGVRWIALPNPMYGSWEAALYGTIADPAERVRLKREALKGMTQ